MTRKILVTATKWSPERFGQLEKVLKQAYRKYNGDVRILVGYTAPGLSIAAIATAVGFQAQMFAPDMDINPKAIDAMNGITITSSSKADYMKFMIEKADGVIAFDKGDPVVFAATKLNKQIWFPFD